ncbi:helix-turn-helix domain-containing protein [Saprospiraceae bacterium]|nr:helix-turn-helix domain-containing protein [Saprospiraceae bacterium]
MRYLFVISGVFAALFFLLLLSKKERKFEHIFLSIIFLLITVNSYYIFEFYHSEEFYYKPFFSELNYAIPMLYGTLLWFYTRALTQARFKFKAIDALHFLPFVLFFLFLISPLIIGTELMESKHIGYPFIKLLVTPFYLFATLLLLKKYREQFKQAYSYELEVNLMWLSWIVAGAIMLWLIASSGYVYNSFSDSPMTLLFDFYVVGFLAIYLFALTFVAITRTDIFSKSKTNVIPVKIEKLEPLEEIEEETPDEEASYSRELNDLKSKVEEDQLYLDPLLSINKLSEITRVPQYKISKILNSQLDQSFYDFINGYRIEAVKEQMDGGAAGDLSILGIALDCGFNSKASFNRVFKKREGITPSQYLKGKR